MSPLAGQSNSDGTKALDLGLLPEGLGIDQQTVEVEDRCVKIPATVHHHDGRQSIALNPTVGQVYSSTWMFFAAQISFSFFGHPVTLTSPRCRRNRCGSPSIASSLRGGNSSLPRQ